MSEMKTNSSSEDTLIRDSQINGFFAFKERIGFCCSRIFKRSSKYDLSSVSKKDEEQQDKPSYINQALQEEKQLRKDKLEKIARTLPGVTSTHTQAMRGPTSVTQTPTRSLTTITQGTPRSGITLAQPRPPISTPVSKTGISTISKPSPLVTNTKTNKNDSDEITDSSKEESSSDDDRSSDSGSAPAKRAPTNRANNRR
ncbi:unnamed protein product [Rotaria magnacalcarata]|uniref:Uncharacterized protein n=1 Tax=Rotaria magnacalcarata TaxID=392030 RepID=A0A816BBI2_9BILA|nr:unnamed protein product [Rotaria magnacalcarata]CAF1617385.1 unnamed protein product [Rotaria magnacalcarata]CAF2033900.1 unnamed protein product [Rotaria magnacalcarata]CAF2092396.1 unnamed protein product [Rotaria magnacalcarata]CAF2133683.1 unnamed protein product [Rotaria magnacalcarata]